MFKTIRPRFLCPRSAYDLVALLALFVALGTGGAYAANTIGSDDVIDESLVSRDIHPDTLTGDDINEATLAGVRVSGLETKSFTPPASSNKLNSVAATCPPGKKAIGVSYSINASDSARPHLVVKGTVITGIHAAIHAMEATPTAESWSLTATALCANAE